MIKNTEEIVKEMAQKSSGIIKNPGVLQKTKAVSSAVAFALALGMSGGAGTDKVKLWDAE
jgi:hypothetical protein